MEQKRTLWIIAATGIFLLVVIGAAMLLYSPSMSAKTVKQASFDSNIGWVSTPKVEEEKNPLSTPSATTAVAESTTSAPSYSETTPVSQPDTSSAAVSVAKVSDTNNSHIQQNPFETPIKADHITVVTDTTTVYTTDKKTIDLNSLNAAAKANVAPKNEYTESKINNNASKNIAIASEPKTTKKPAQESKASAPKTAAKAPVASSKPKASSSTPAKNQSVAKASAQNTFWVQAAAYSSKKNADEARNVLESNKIPTEVFTVDANGTMMYRVRVGPYTTKTEAEYWQKEIAKIEKFADTKSQIFSTKIN